MTLLSDQKTQISVGPGDPPYDSHVVVRLSPVLMGNRRDQYDTVTLWLTTGEARKLRDDLTRELARQGERGEP